MADLIKYVVGIDISKDSFDACIGSIDTEQNIVILPSKKFKNTKEGFVELLKWSKSNQSQGSQIWFVMEATGVYFENLAYHLSKKKQQLNIVLPTKMKHFKQSTEVKTKTDSIDAKILTRYGLERQLEVWKEPIEEMKEIRDLCREHSGLTAMSTEIKNQMHAKKSSYKASTKTLKRLNDHLNFLEKQSTSIINEIKLKLDKMPEVKSKIEMIENSLKGVGFITLIKLVSETDGFAFISNGNQLSSYAGLDVVESQSGNVSGKTKISTKGNSNIRKALYMSSLSVIRHTQRYKDFYQGLLIRNKEKMVGVVAVMRKLLLLIYTLWKKNEPFIDNYNFKLKETIIL